MLKRIALVVWWLGAISLGFGAIGFFASLIAMEPNHKGDTALLALGTGAFCGACCWTLTFILAGSFLRPPTTN